MPSFTPAMATSATIINTHKCSIPMVSAIKMAINGPIANPSLPPVTNKLTIKPACSELSLPARAAISG